MPLFWKPYTSDVTRFIDQLKADKPTLEAEQRAGRALLWDKQIDRQAQADYGDSAVPQTPYVYFPKPAAALANPPAKPPTKPPAKPSEPR